MKTYQITRTYNGRQQTFNTKTNSWGFSADRFSDEFTADAIQARAIFNKVSANSRRTSTTSNAKMLSR